VAAFANSAASEDGHLADLIALLHRSNIRVDALFSSTDADELGKHRDRLLADAREIKALNSKHRLDLAMTWNRCGQVQVKRCAAPSGGLGPQAPTMRLDD
jgi:hypothetical protein